MKVKHLFNKYHKYTIGWWFNQIEDLEIRRKALENCKKIYGEAKLEIDCFTLHDAIDRGLHWDRTPEGHTYWEVIYKKYKNRKNEG